MRVLQVVTLVAPGNPFGGPLSVALNQSRALEELGHQVEVIAAIPANPDSSWSPPGGVRGFRSRQVSKRAGFSGVLSIRLLVFVIRRIRTFDVVHVHLARDLVALPTAALARTFRVPYVVQTHGMVDPSSRLLARTLDRLITVRVLRSAKEVLSLTTKEDGDLASVVAPHPIRTRRLENGILLTQGDRTAHRDSPPLVLFCSRLHERKRPVLFVQAAKALVEAGRRDVTFAIVGPDEGERNRVEEVISSCPALASRIAVVGAVEPETALEWIRRATVLALPSVNEPFPMIAVEALAEGCLVIITHECGLSPMILRSDGGVVIEPDSVDALTVAFEFALANPEVTRARAVRGRSEAIENLDIRHIAALLDKIYRDAAASTVKSQS